jgi:LPXTG-site transpeptidase (sortase) family protein
MLVEALAVSTSILSNELVVEEVFMHFFQRYRYGVALVLFLACLGLGGLTWFLVVQSMKQGGAKTITAGATVMAGPVEVGPAGAPRSTDGRGHEVSGRLIIPAISVDAPIEAVGLLPGNIMGVPMRHQWDGVGWYQNGPLPGERGSAVIDGHLDKPGGSPAVFWRLNKLQVGDSVIVTRPGQVVQYFQVMKLAYYQPIEAPLSTIFQDRSGTYLNLVTCAGDRIPIEHETSLRLVVYTKMV